ncbi:putative alpha-tocopherol transfer protein [Danaus plexippus plexippus]|uniref:Alpha-tocopherol transfer protein n=1 Tax=Danaus plexippus plexippus TaxID=278856 RepID=A0A212EYZ5_DANPL|nr:putative alpha-tocopherol transfer protein [Danaus plexippus plexippus]
MTQTTKDTTKIRTGRRLQPAMPFIDIAFQAEVSRFEDQEFEECARRNCSEDPETRQTAIHNLRNLIYQRGECNPRRLDDAYLLRFLRCRRFIPALAHKLVKHK